MQDSAQVKLSVDGELVCGSALRFASSSKLEEVRKLLTDYLGAEVTCEFTSLPEGEWKKFNPNALAEWVGKFSKQGEYGRQLFLAVYMGDGFTTVESVKRLHQTRSSRKADGIKDLSSPSGRGGVRLTSEFARPLPSKVDRTPFRLQVEKRGIQRLTHFTRIENLRSILINGIQSRAVLGNAEYQANDQFRMDRRWNASCISISFPNYSLFYKMRENAPGSQWVVLSLDPRLLWELECGFTKYNAAKSEMAEIPEWELKTPEAFDSLFFDAEYRIEEDIPDHLPTNPQAEVLAFQTVPPEYITEIHTVTNVQQVHAIVGGTGRQVPVRARDELFKYGIVLPSGTRW